MGESAKGLDHELFAQQNNALNSGIHQTEFFGHSSHFETKLRAPTSTGTKFLCYKLLPRKDPMQEMPPWKVGKPSCLPRRPRK